MSEHFDALETRSPEEREAALLDALRQQVAHAKAKAPYWGELLSNVDPAALTDRAMLARLPVTYKADLVEAQAMRPPFGGMNATPPGALARLFLSPGPIAEPEGRGDDWWRAARAIWAAGFRKGDLVHNCFSYHFTPAGMIFESGARAIGCAVFPGGVGQTEMQVQAIAFYRATGFVGTPDFLKIVLDKAHELGADISSLTKAMVGGGALTPALRAEIEGRGVAVLQNYGTADLGIVAYESKAKEGMIVDEQVIVEIVRPGTGDPVPEGEVGEVVVTLVANRDYPLIRFATGDLSAILPGPSPCGRTAPRIRGWMGRADQSTKVRGMFVRPSQIDRVAKRHPEIGRLRLIVESANNLDTMRLVCEAGSRPEGLADAIAETLRAETGIRGAVELAAPGTLPNDGKVIEDARKYD